MKIHRLETHDRLLSFKQEQAVNIQQGADDCLKRNPLSLALQDRSPYVYLFAHPRTHEDGVTKVMYWQPRLGKPAAQTNSYLFRATSHTDIIEVCWMLPPREMWDQYKKGNVTESDWVLWSIDQFTNNRKQLEAPFSEDFSQEKINQILLEIAREMEQEAKLRKIKPNSLEVSSTS